MNPLFRLQNPIKHYDWGSPQWIPQLLGVANPEGLPWAELWMGVHPEGPSITEYAGTALPLASLIAQDPAGYVGTAIQQAFGTLPFLFKLLAVEQPLSLQAHPNKEQAQRGWERENQLGIPLKAPYRNYKDPSHKPEIICALSPFTALCGFQEPEQIVQGVAVFAQSAPEPLYTALHRLVQTLEAGATAQRLRAFLQGLFGLPVAVGQALSAYGRDQKERLINEYPVYKQAWELMAYGAERYPGDPAVLAPLYLNRIDLAPGEGLYLPAGVLHGYLRGFGVELMANSDNVLRGGLSSKHVDKEELVRILDFSVFHPQILRSQGGRYQTQVQEFSLWVMEGQGDQIQDPQFLPGILIVTQGKLHITFSSGEGEWNLMQGESAFIPAGKPADLHFRGTYTLYGAGIGSLYVMEDKDENTGGC
ncbi:MAG: mannose-6-phosphate isomerase, class I [Treponema sp.]|jgi:mannose-6-phosphate isomerase|nr:mannose-6-phosphate isomerase, class I [Treponema sp.]